jgi:hypothetical protein
MAFSDLDRAWHPLGKWMEHVVRFHLTSSSQRSRSGQHSPNTKFVAEGRQPQKYQD